MEACFAGRSWHNSNWGATRGTQSTSNIRHRKQFSSLFLGLGGAAVHRCEIWHILSDAFYRLRKNGFYRLRKNSGFVSGHRFSDAVSSLNFACPFRGWTRRRCFSAICLAAEGTHYTPLRKPL